MNMLCYAVSKMNFIPRQAVNPFIQVKCVIKKASKVVQRQYNKTIITGLKQPEVMLVRQPKTDVFIEKTAMQDILPIKHKIFKVRNNVDKQALTTYFDNSAAIEEEVAKPLSKQELIITKQQWYDNTLAEYSIKEKQDFKKLEAEFEREINQEIYFDCHGFDEGDLAFEYKEFLARSAAKLTP